MRYAPSPPPSDPKQAAAYTRSELERLTRELTAPKVLELAVSYAAPDKPRQGYVIYADGTSFDPGSGEGLYRHNGSAWIFIG